MSEVRFFADRSLGDVLVPRALREAGWNVVAMRERYGQVTAEGLADIDWIGDATAEGEVLLTGDKAIAKVPIEARAIVDAGARVFALANNTLTAAQKTDRFLQHEEAILRRALTAPAPYVVSVTEQGLVVIKLFG